MPQSISHNFYTISVKTISYTTKSLIKQRIEYYCQGYEKVKASSVSGTNQETSHSTQDETTTVRLETGNFCLEFPSPVTISFNLVLKTH